MPRTAKIHRYQLSTDTAFELRQTSVCSSLVLRQLAQYREGFAHYIAHACSGAAEGDARGIRTLTTTLFRICQLLFAELVEMPGVFRFAVAGRPMPPHALGQPHANLAYNVSAFTQCVVLDEPGMQRFTQ